MKYMLEEVGLKLPVEVLSDSSAGRSMCHRLGSGALKHVQTKFFWVQEAVQQGLLKISVVRGSDNPADLGTKAVTRAVLMHLLPRCGMIMDTNEITVAAASSSSTAAAVPHINHQALAAIVALLQALTVKGDDGAGSDNGWYGIVGKVVLTTMVLLAAAFYLTRKKQHEKKEKWLELLREAREEEESWFAHHGQAWAEDMGCDWDENPYWH
jgi:hypothetical protein